MPTKDNRCTQSIYSGNFYHKSRCSKRGTIKRDGKLFCWQHDPVRKNKEREEKYKVFRQKQDKKAEAHERTCILLNMADGISTNQLRSYKLVKK